ncbi:uncharacterized protein LOC107980939 isoform X2 [Nasonia vitripennis]|uniref:Uncharacterized protein n=1 Tax=Nasonia vitripennis TaxID=7425 RepID=A0A7M7IQ41_NASVI|nr:uncharacterized protein LOC107980939 isoform X2 [Nasonia vitripennis]
MGDSDKFVKKKLSLNRQRVRNHRTKMKMAKEAENSGNNLVVEHELPLAPKIQHLEDKTEKNQGNRCEIIQEPLFPDQSKTVAESTSIVDDNEPAISNHERFSSDESSSDSDGADECESETDNKYEETPFVRNLKIWYFNHIISQTHLDKLLKTLKPYHPKLPECSKTFLKVSAVDKCYEITKF